MPCSSFLPITEQVAAHLGEELRRGRWKGAMPGRNQLVKELGVSGRTVELALQLLEKEGLLVRQGAGRARLIELPENHDTPPLRVGVLAYEDLNRRLDYMVDLRHLLVEAGHVAFFASRTLLELRMDVKRIRRVVEASEAGAWVVISAPCPVLEWFAEQPLPAFALFGRRAEVRIAAAGPDHVPAMRCLLGHGHRRISFLCRRQLRQPQPGMTVRAFLATLEAAGISTGTFNLPTGRRAGKASSASWTRCSDTLRPPH